jgi:general stress protein YciG
MAGTRAGGIKSREANLAKNPNHYKEISVMGGNTPKTKPAGFASMTPEKHKELSAKGGAASRRGSV